MTKILPTITIGVPAYNEEANIGHLLSSLLTQELRSFVIEKIIVNSDGSDDRTAEIVNSFKSTKIILFDDKKRKGQSIRQNEIIENTTSDILVLLNADIKLSGNDYVELLCRPIKDGADLVSSKVLSMAPKGFFEKVLKASYDYKEDLFESIDNGRNIYTCKGAARSMSRRYYKDFRFGMSVGEDAYTYLYCISRQLNYYYQPLCIAFIRLPDNLSDYLKQSTRFLDSRDRFSKEFGRDFVAKQYEIPKGNTLKILFANFIKNHLFTLVYLVVFGISTIKIKMSKKQESGDVWEIAKSSKKLI